jgi:hypothetical protein
MFRPKRKKHLTRGLLKSIPKTFCLSLVHLTVSKGIISKRSQPSGCGCSTSKILIIMTKTTCCNILFERHQRFLTDSRNHYVYQFSRIWTRSTGKRCVLSWLEPKTRWSSAIPEVVCNGRRFQHHWRSTWFYYRKSFEYKLAQCGLRSEGSATRCHGRFAGTDEKYWIMQNYAKDNLSKNLLKRLEIASWFDSINSKVLFMTDFFLHIS